MRKILLSFLFVLITFFSLNAQFSSDLVVLSSTNDYIFVTIDNARVNTYQSNKVRVNDITPGVHNIKIILQNNTKTVLVQPIIIPENAEFAVVVSKNQFGIYYLESFVAMDYSGNNFDNNIEPLPPVPQPTNDGFCNYPIDETAFANALSSIKNQDFDSEKLTVAKQIASSNCLYSKYVKTIILEFSFESSKLEFAKFAYSHVYDPENFYLVNDAFDFSSSIDDLNDYISSLD